MEKYLDKEGAQRLVNKILELLDEKADIEELELLLDEVAASAQRAGQSAVVAGNYAAQAIQAQQAVENKIWYGTIGEYNNLETVNSSTIYIILHE